MAVLSLQSRHLIEHVKLAWSRSALPGFLHWWGSELVTLLPPRLRAWVQRGPDVLWLSMSPTLPGALRVRTGAVLATIAADLPADSQRATFTKACAGSDPDDRRLLLVVSGGSVLHRRLAMPVAAVIDPRKVVGYELDRQTPFEPAQLYYDVRVSTDPAPPRQVILDLYAAPRAELDPMLERLALLGAHPDGIDVQRADGVLAGVDLLPPERRPRRVDRRRRVNWALGTACVVLLVVVLMQWLGNRRAVLAQMQKQVQIMRVQANRSEHLRAQLLTALAASKFLVKRKAQNPSALAVLEDLTKQLPSTAWLDALTLDRAGGLDIKGEAAKAAGLVDTLGNSTVLEAPKLQGAIQPDPATGKERFELVAHIRKQETTDAH